MPGRKILIVEGDLDLRRALAAEMGAAGAEVLVARDAPDALARLHAGAAPAVVLLALGHAGSLDGQQLLRELRADPRFEHLPVITIDPGAPRARGDAAGRPPRGVELDDLRQIVESLLDAA